MIRARNLTFAYTPADTGWRRTDYDGPIVRDLSFDVERGQIVALAGPSGSGKTTILRLAIGALVASSGSVEGPAAGSNAAWYAAQSPALIGFRTVLENIILPREVSGPLTAVDVDEALGAARAVGLGGDIRRLPGELSGGMKRRVALAQALCAPRALVVLDEPFSELDVVSRQAAEDATDRMIRGQGRTALFASHDVDSIAAVADRVLIISGPPAFRLTSLDLTAYFPLSQRASDRRAESSFRNAAVAIQDALITGTLAT